MKLTSKIAIDRLMGLPLAWGLNFAARILGRVLNRNHSNAPEQVRTIVFAKYLGMGSIIQATPLIRSVKQRYPAARIVFLTGVGCRTFVERLEHIDEVITIDDRSLVKVASSSFHAMRLLMQKKVDLFFDLEVYSSYACIMALLSLSRNRIGFFRESAEHKRGNYTHLVYLNTRFPVRHAYLQLGRLIGCQPVHENRLGSILLMPQDHEQANALLNQWGIKAANYVVVNPNASDLILERRWPAAQFAAFITHIVSGLGRQVILPGAPGEREYNEYIRSLLPMSVRGEVFNIAGQANITTFLALLSQAACVVTNDTGPMHMAWALDVPTVSLFGPCSPEQYGWNAGNNLSLYKPLYCSPCVHEIDFPPCKGNNVCMQRIEVQEVIEAVNHVLQQKGREKNYMPFTEDFFVDEHGTALGKVVPIIDYPEVAS